jgi:hypothetical protein
MFAQEATQDRPPHHTSRSAPRLGDMRTSRVIVGPPVGDGRVAYVHRIEARHVAVRAEVLISLHGYKPGALSEELLLQTGVRRCDLWNGDFDEALKSWVLWTGWAVTRIERRELGQR